MAAQGIEGEFRVRGADSGGEGADGNEDHESIMLRSSSVFAVLLLAVQALGAAAFAASPGTTGLPSLRRGPVLAALMAEAQGAAAERTMPLAAPLPVGLVVTLGESSGLGGELTLRLRGGKKGTASQGKRGTGGKSHPSYKYNLSYPRISRHQTSKRKRYCLKKKPEREGRCKHLRLVNRRFKNGFRASPPYAGPKEIAERKGEA